MAVLNIFQDLELISDSSNNVEVMSGPRNCYYEKLGQEDQYLTQRAGFKVNDVDPGFIPGDVPSGIFRTQDGARLYISSNGRFFLNSYSNQIFSGLLSVRTFMCENNDDIFINSNDKNSYYIDSANQSTVLPITQLDNIISSSGLKLAKGCATLNGTTYVQMESGEIYNSAVQDIKSWNSLDFLSSELLEDKAFYLDTISNHIVSFNASSIEFFYDNNNPTGSPLNVRADVSIQIGGLDKLSYFKSGDSIYFLGKTAGGEVSFYVLNNFSVTKLLDGKLSSFIDFITFPSVTGYEYNGRLFVTIGPVLISTGPIVFNSIVYDTKNGKFHLMDYFNLNFVSSTYSSASNSILVSNGDIITTNVFSLNNLAEDSDRFNIKTKIKSEIVIRESNFNTNNFKRIKRISINSRSTESDFYIDIEASLHGNLKFKRQFNVNRLVDIKKAQRLGRFKSLEFKIRFGDVTGNDSTESSPEYTHLRSIEVDF